MSEVPLYQKKQMDTVCEAQCVESETDIFIEEGEGRLSNSQTRPLHTSDEDGTRHQGSNSP